jgi:hypothetical protein
VNRDEALGLLPATYALALRLRDAGSSDVVIATRLGIEREAVGPLLRIARAKLGRLLAEPAGQIE